LADLVCLGPQIEVVERQVAERKIAATKGPTEPEFHPGNQLPVGSAALAEQTLALNPVQGRVIEYFHG
jgi:hypothetical protein